jgi:hypothetical protein
MIAEMNRRIFKKINGIIYEFATLEDDDTVDRELKHQDTNSDAWYDLAERALAWEFPDNHNEIAADLFAVAKLILNRNAYHDGLPFCPLCGKIGNPEHNGAPVIAAQVCEACNQRKIIPARIRAAQKEEA